MHVATKRRPKRSLAFLSITEIEKKKVREIIEQMLVNSKIRQDIRKLLYTNKAQCSLNFHEWRSRDSYIKGVRFKRYKATSIMRYINSVKGDPAFKKFCGLLPNRIINKPLINNKSFSYLGEGTSKGKNVKILPMEFYKSRSTKMNMALKGYDSSFNTACSINQKKKLLPNIPNKYLGSSVDEHGSKLLKAIQKNNWRIKLCIFNN